MNKIGRNDKCSCGSGKKYKNCCARGINTQPQDIRNSFCKNQYYTFNGRFNVPTHDSCKSIKDYAIAIFEQMIGYIDDKRDDTIIEDCNYLLNLVEKGEEYYYTELKEILKLKRLNSSSIEEFIKEKRTHINDCKLSNSEKIIIYHVATSNLSEYFMQTDSNKLDYGAMRVLAELGQQALSSNISKDNVITGATIYVDKDELKSWKLDVRDGKDNIVDIKAPLYIQWIPL